MDGQILSGRYRLVRVLDAGGMGTVWLAEHASLRVSVAVKIIDAELARTPDARARFDREAYVVARLRSAHVVKVLDHGVTEADQPYIAMEHLAGESLRRRIAARGRLTPHETAAVLSGVARGLACAHDAGLVHRDVKPGNIFLAREDGDEVVKMLDFGAAKVNDALGLPGVSPTRTGTILGTPDYMSPEQAQGLKTVDRRSDVWSLGVVAYECLTGKRPFVARGLAPLVARIVGAPVPVPSEVAPEANLPPEIDAWMGRALARAPGDRFPSAGALAASFRAAAGASDEGEHGAPYGPTALETAGPPGRDGGADGATRVLAPGPLGAAEPASVAGAVDAVATVDGDAPHDAPHDTPTVPGAPPRVDFYPSLLEIAKVLLRESGGERTAEVLLQRVVELTGADRGFLVVREGDAYERRFDVAFDPSRETDEERRFSRGLVRRAVDTQAQVHTADVTADERFRGIGESVLALGGRAVLVAPLHDAAEVYGVLYLERRGPVDFTAEARRFLTDVADVAGLFLRRALERDTLLRQYRSLERDLFARHDFQGIVTQDPGMLEVLRTVAQVADADAAVLVRGETGTGKELVARALHVNGRRRDKPFVALHCTAIAGTILESELFGHTRGAFTGADRARAGRIAAAQGGTLFLDEIAEIPLEIQAKLLRFLQFGEIQRLGADRTETVDVRVVAATHRDLAALVREGRFRQDLYYRLNILELILPPLRERRRDVALLLDHFLRKHWRHPGAAPRWTAAAEQALAAYEYPGNVRELAHLVERACLLARSPALDVDLFPARGRRARRRPRAPSGRRLRALLGRGAGRRARGGRGRGGGRVPHRPDEAERRQRLARGAHLRAAPDLPAQAPGAAPREGRVARLRREPVSLPRDTRSTGQRAPLGGRSSPSRDTSAAERAVLRVARALRKGSSRSPENTASQEGFMNNHRRGYLGVRAVAGAFVGLFALCASTHCGSQADAPTCEQAVGNLYAEGCSLSVGGSNISEGDAISGCMQSQTEIASGSCACGSQFDAALSCLGGIGQGQCTACVTEFAAYDACVSACSTSSGSSSESSSGSSGGSSVTCTVVSDPGSCELQAYAGASATVGPGQTATVGTSCCGNCGCVAVEVYYDGSQCWEGIPSCSQGPVSEFAGTWFDPHAP